MLSDVWSTQAGFHPGALSVTTGNTERRVFNLTPEILAASPAVLIGTPKQCAAELTRRAEHWNISQFIFGSAMGIDENQIRRLRKEVMLQISS